MCGRLDKMNAFILLTCVFGVCAATDYLPETYRHIGGYRQELVDPFGNVRGGYSHVDPAGQTFSVKYNAGGFQLDNTYPQTASLLTQGNQRKIYVTPSNPFDFLPKKPIFNPIELRQRYPDFSAELPSPPQPESATFRPSPLDPAINEIPAPETLFKPASTPYPAETQKQIEAYNTALREQAMEDAKEADNLQNSLTSQDDQPQQQDFSQLNAYPGQPQPQTYIQPTYQNQEPLKQVNFDQQIIYGQPSNIGVQSSYGQDQGFASFPASPRFGQPSFGQQSYVNVKLGDDKQYSYSL